WLVIVEIAYGDRQHAVTKKALDTVSSGNVNTTNVQHIQLRTNTELWHKENAINLAFNCLPDSWKYAAWIDADVTFTRPGILEETIHKLQHHAVVQMWSQGLDLDPIGHTLQE